MWFSKRGWKTSRHLNTMNVYYNMYCVLHPVLCIISDSSSLNVACRSDKYTHTISPLPISSQVSSSPSHLAGHTSLLAHRLAPAQLCPDSLSSSPLPIPSFPLPHPPVKCSDTLGREAIYGTSTDQFFPPTHPLSLSRIPAELPTLLLPASTSVFFFHTTCRWPFIAPPVLTLPWPPRLLEPPRIDMLEAER